MNTSSWGTPLPGLTRTKPQSRSWVEPLREVWNDLFDRVFDTWNEGGKLGYLDMDSRIEERLDRTWRYHR
jgi:hypothetical protein